MTILISRIFQAVPRFLRGAAFLFLLTVFAFAVQAATGDSAASNLTVQGSTITAGNIATLKADGQVNLQAAQNTAEQHSTNSSSSATIQSGGDTTLKGAVIAGNTVKADIGGNLNIQSLQDTSQFTSRQKSTGAGVSLCIPPLCYGSSSVSVSCPTVPASKPDQFQASFSTS